MTQVISAVAGYRFDGFHLDARNRQLWRDGKTVPLSSKYFDVLLMLVSRGGELVETQRNLLSRQAFLVPTSFSITTPNRMLSCSSAAKRKSKRYAHKFWLIVHSS